MSYCTLICDIKSSRKLKNREEIQYKIINMLKIVNENFKDIIVSPFIITIGDEWQGLLKYPCDYKEIILFFKKSIPDIKFYTGIGIGNVYIHNFELTVNQLDGPSFYRARDALKYAKRNKLPLVILFDDWDNI
ncbi:SatD family protein [Haloimpatiens sp. FM7330]|uniref:SatD family protein n=1 Tax=Haloimpatiens sp. FM7330 TaxID=3298610 RepID=UPI003632886C